MAESRLVIHAGRSGRSTTVELNGVDITGITQAVTIECGVAVTTVDIRIVPEVVDFDGAADASIHREVLLKHEVKAA